MNKLVTIKVRYITRGLLKQVAAMKKQDMINVVATLVDNEYKKEERKFLKRVSKLNKIKSNSL